MLRGLRCSMFSLKVHSSLQGATQILHLCVLLKVPQSSLLSLQVFCGVSVSDVYFHIIDCPQNSGLKPKLFTAPSSVGREFEWAQQRWPISALCGIGWGRPKGFIPCWVPQLQWLRYLEDGPVSLSRRVVGLLFRVAQGSKRVKLEAVRYLKA